MDETAPATRSALKSKESPSSLIFYSGAFFFNFSARRGGDLTLSVGGFQTVMGTTANGCSADPPKRFFAFAADLKGGYELKTIGASAVGDGARSGFLIGVDGEDEDASNLGTLAKAGRPFSAKPEFLRFILRGFRDSVSN